MWFNLVGCWPTVVSIGSEDHGLELLKFLSILIAPHWKVLYTKLKLFAILLFLRNGFQFTFEMRMH